MLRRESCFAGIAILAMAAYSLADDKAEMGRLVGVGQNLQKQGKFKEAIDVYDRAAVICLREFGPKHKFTATLSSMSGGLYRQLGQYPEAETRLQTALTAYEQGTDPQLIAEAVNNLAAVKYELGKYEEALALHLRGVKMMETSFGPNSPSTAVSRGNLAGVYSSLSQDSLALPLYLQSVKTLEAHSATHGGQLADSLANLANMYLKQGEMARAVPLVQRAIAIKEQAYGPNHFEVARTLNNLGSMYIQMGQYEKAEEVMNRTLVILEATLGSNHADVARALTNLAAAQKRLKKYEPSEANYLRALKIRETALGADHLDVAITLEHLGSLYQSLKRFPEAITYAERALELRRKKLGESETPVAYSLASLAGIQMMQGKFNEAEVLIRDAIQIRTAKLAPGNPTISESYATLGAIDAATGRFDQSVRDFDQSRRSIRTYVAQSLSVLSEPEQIAFLKNVDRTSFNGALSAAYYSGNQRAHDSSAAWVLNSKGVAQEVLGQRALIGRDSTNPLLAVVSRTLIGIRKQLASLSLVGFEIGNDASRRKKMDDLADREAKAARQMAQDAGRPVLRADFVSIDQVRRNIPDDAVLVEIVRFGLTQFKVFEEDFPERYVAWIIPPAGEAQVRFIDLGPAETIDEAITAARTKLTQSPESIRESGEPEAELEMKTALQPLSKLVLEPLLASLGTSETIYLSPDAGLWIVPWSALPLPDGRYAVERYDIRYLISGRDLIPPEGKPLEATPPVLFADPNYDLTPAEVQVATQELFKRPISVGPVHAIPSGNNRLGKSPRLPGTKREASLIQPKIENLANTKATLYSDKSALEAMFKRLQRPQILVVSTHGFFRETSDEGASGIAESANPLLRCGLLLAGCNKPADVTAEDVEDGILTGLEIIGTDLRGTDLVVLSACETGLGEVRNGEGVSGLRQAFQLAGARSVVATLWQIPDRETSQLMTDFFSQLADGVDRSAALREAQLKMIAARRERNEAAHPFFWAAFTLTGR